MLHDTSRHREATGTGDKEGLDEAFVGAFVRLIQMARIHRASNHMVVDAADEFIRTGKRYLEEDSVLALQARHSRLFLQGERMLFKRRAAVSIFTLLGFISRLGIYGFEFNSLFRDISREQAYRFACEILEALRRDHPLEWLDERLESEDYQWVSIIYHLREPQTEVASTEKVELVHQLYSYSYNAVQEISEKLQKGQSAGIRKPLRVVQDIADLVSVDKSILMGSLTIRDYDNYTFTHSVNVAIQAICMGHELGLSRQSLVRLGICGLFHDLGKVDIPREIINKPGPLSKDESRMVKRHSLNSVRRMIKLEASPDLLAGIILPPLEHHLRYDLKGYPEVGWTRSLSFFGRIIQICDVFDALTSSRVYRTTPLSPDRAIGYMLEGSGTVFDPLLLKWFVNLQGVMPVGTVVGLNTGELGLISHGGDLQKKRLPHLFLLERTEQGFRRGETVDLNQVKAREGQSTRRIRTTHHPAEFGIQPFLYFQQG